MISLFLYIISVSIISYLSFHFLLKLNKLTQLKKNNDKGERWGTQKKPIIGGIGFYIAFLWGIGVYLIKFINNTISNDLIILFTICTLGFASGLWDDLKGSTPRVKLIIQLLIGTLFIFTNNHITAFNSNWINYPMTLFWVIAIMNSINMLDNMDAITTSVSAVIILSLISIEYYHLQELSFYSFIGIGIFLSLLIFLRWNWNPSKMYMGDNGSQFLGAFLAFLGIKIVWNCNIPSTGSFPIDQIIILSLSFIVTFSDTATVTINRLRAGKSPFIGGKDHTTHHLSYHG